MVLSQASSLILISLAAAGLPSLSRLIRLPSPVVEILFGVILGRSLLNIEVSGEWLTFLAELGFLVLMFQAGLEIDFRTLLNQSLGRLALQFGVFGATLSLSLISALMIGRGVFFALVLSTTSLGLVLPILKETGKGDKNRVQTILIAATLADFLTLLGITVYNMWNQFGLSWQLVSPLPLFLGFGLALWAGRLWAWWYPRRAEKLLLSPDPQERGVRLAMALLFLFVGFSEVVHLEPVLGAFMGGGIISFVFREKEELESKISAVGFGFLIPIFFIHVGMQFDVTNITSIDQLKFIGLILVLAFGVKVLPGMLFVLQGWSLGQGLRTGLLLSSRLSLIVAAASIGLAQGYLDNETKDSIVLLALLTCFLGPTLYKLSLGRGDRDRASGGGDKP